MRGAMSNMSTDACSWMRGAERISCRMRGATRRRAIADEQACWATTSRVTSRRRRVAGGEATSDADASRGELWGLARSHAQAVGATPAV
jgi:hypothetical protein